MCFSPFRMADVQFFVNSCCIRASNAYLYNLRRSTFVSLAFKDHNNTLHRDYIIHGCSGY